MGGGLRVVGAFDADRVRNPDRQRRGRGVYHPTSGFDHSEIGDDAVKRRARYVARGVSHALPIEKLALNRQQLGEQRADDREDDDPDEQLDQREAATNLLDVVCHWQ